MQATVLESLVAARSAGRPVVLATPLSGAPQRLLDLPALDALSAAEPELAAAARLALETDEAQRHGDGADEILLVPYNPPLRLVIVGAVHIATFLNTLARVAGYRVTVVDPREAFLRAAQFPGAELVGAWPQHAFPRLAPDARTAVVLLTHDPKIDDPALGEVLAGPAFYVGALGSQRTHARRLERLAAAGFRPAQLARIHGPAGLAIGARTPAEIALSVLAQMTAVLRGQAGTR
jgi:xanthine dehydrogenase accessory factor